MLIGQSVYVRHAGKLLIGVIQEIFEEDLEIALENNERITRKYWEIRKVEIKDEEKENN